MQAGASWFSRRRCSAAGWFVFGMVFLAAGCQSMPSPVEQEQMVRDRRLTLWQISPKAVEAVWGKPSYLRNEFTHFFVMPDRSMIPRSRVPLGEPPANWDAGVDAGDAVFVGYPEQGWLLVFFDDRLVYREELKADKIHELGKMWKHEERFRTRLDGQPLR